MDQTVIQILVWVIAVSASAVLLRKSIYWALFLIQTPLIFYQNISLQILTISFLLSILVVNFLSKPKRISKFILAVLIFFSILLGFRTTHLYQTNSNVIDSQRGEHGQLGSNKVARLLHNKSALIFSFIDHGVKNLSLSRIYASGNYNLISSTLPFGLLFPGGLFLIIYSLVKFKSQYEYLKVWPILLTLFLMVSLFEGTIMLISLYTFIFILNILAAESLLKLNSKIQIALIIASLAYLSIYLIPANIFWILEKV